MKMAPVCIESISCFRRVSQTIECSPGYAEKRFDMNHPIDLDPESNRRADQDPESSRRAKPTTHLREVCKQAVSSSPDSDRLKLLDTLIRKIVQGLDDDSCKPKIRDALKAIQLREKVAETSEAEQIFWGMIDDIKKEEYSEPSSVPPSLASQIQEIILSLKHLVKNGILPLKAITEAFNQGRFQQARLTSRRMSRLLSDMGFAKARTPTGSSAIIWDDYLLSQDTPSDARSSTSEGVPRSPGDPACGEDLPGDLLTYTIPSG
jgi:hypothetical protein